MEKTISVRIPAQEMKAISHIAKDVNATKSFIMREILTLGIQQKRQDLALNLFQNKQATAWKAAALANMPLTEFLDLLKRKGLEFNYTEEEFLEDVKNL